MATGVALALFRFSLVGGWHKTVSPVPDEPVVLLDLGMGRVLAKITPDPVALHWRPRAPYPQTDAPITYFIQPATGGPIKIGRTTWGRLAARVKDLQCASPYRLRVLLVVEGNFETALHNRFRHLRLSGEWFEPAEELAAACGGAWHRAEIDKDQIGYDLGRRHGYIEGRESLIHLVEVAA